MLENLSDCREHKSSLATIVQVKQDFIVIFFVPSEKESRHLQNGFGDGCRLSVRHSPGKCIIQHGVALIERKREERGGDRGEKRQSITTSCRKEDSPQVCGERGRFVRGGKGGVGCEQVL